jgi:hypothetical protein
MTDAQWRDEAQMLDRLCALLASSERDSIAAVDVRACAASRRVDDTHATFALYDSAMASAQAMVWPSMRPLVAACLRYALHYVPVPAVALRDSASPANLLAEARAAVNRRNTLAGRCLPADTAGRRRQPARASSNGGQCLCGLARTRSRPPARSPASGCDPCFRRAAREIRARRCRISTWARCYGSWG